MNLLLFNYTLSVKSVYLYLKFYFVLCTANVVLVYTNDLHIPYFKIIIVYSLSFFFAPNFPSNIRNIQML